MSLVHYTPDTAVVPCLGCNELIRDEDLVQHNTHFGASTFFWHPYHFWCIRKDPPPLRSRLACSDCGLFLKAEAIRAAVAWGATFDRRLKARMVPATSGGRVHEHPSAATPRPAGLRLVQVVVPNRMSAPPQQTDLAGEEARALEALLGPELRFEGGRTWNFEFVHDVCPREDSFITQLRGQRPTDAVLAVYGDSLEQQGQTSRAEFVRVSVQRRAATGEPRQALSLRLRELRQLLPGSWCRVVMGAGFP